MFPGVLLTIDQGWGQIRFIKYKYKNLDFSNTNTNTNISSDGFSNTNTNTNTDICVFKYKYKYKYKYVFDPSPAIDQPLDILSVAPLGTLQWRYNERDGVSNRRLLDFLHNRLFRRRSKKTSKLCVTGLCEGNPSVTGWFPSQRPVTRKIFPFDDVIMNKCHWMEWCQTATSHSAPPGSKANSSNEPLGAARNIFALYKHVYKNEYYNNKSGAPEMWLERLRITYTIYSRSENKIQ